MTPRSGTRPATGCGAGVGELTIRPAFPDDAIALERLAQLDSAAVPAGELLLASVDGELVAALAIKTGTAIADPFRPTAAVVDLLARRARQLRGDDKRPAIERVRARLARPPRAARRAPV